MNPRYGQEMPHEPDEQDKELNRIFREELASDEARIAAAGKLPPDEELHKELGDLYKAEANKRGDMIERLRLVNHCLAQFKNKDYLGNGLADEMPLGEVMGFFETKGEGQVAKAVAASLQGEITGHTPLFQLRKRFHEESENLSAILHGEKEEAEN